MKRRILALVMSAAMAVTLLPAFSVKAENSSDRKRLQYLQS